MRLFGWSKGLFSSIYFAGIKINRFNSFYGGFYQLTECWANQVLRQLVRIRPAARIRRNYILNTTWMDWRNVAWSVAKGVQDADLSKSNDVVGWLPPNQRGRTGDSLIYHSRRPYCQFLLASARFLGRAFDYQIVTFNIGLDFYSFKQLLFDYIILCTRRLDLVNRITVKELL